MVTLGVAGIGFAGGFLSARWQAGNNLEQWRRDKLLGFCSDLLAATTDLTQLSDRGTAFPEAKWERLLNLEKCVLLLSDELSAPLNALASDALGLAQKMSQEVHLQASTAGLIAQVAQRESEFVDAARHLLLNDRQTPTLPWLQLWSQVIGKPEAKAAATQANQESPGQSGGTSPRDDAPADRTGPS